MVLELQDDKTIVRYLLGELPEAEQAQLEDRAFSDSDYLQQVRSVEKDLIDEYVRGELAGKERDAFERRFVASEGRRRQVVFARSFGQVIDEVSLDERSVVINSWWSVFRRSNLAVSFSLAAVALIIVIGGLWFIRQSTQSERRQAQLQPTPQPTAVVQENATPGGDQKPQPNPSLARLPEIAPPQRSVIASLILLPGTSRGADNRPQLTIPPSTALAELRVVLESGDDYKDYVVEVRTISGKLVRSQSGLTAHPSAGGHAVKVSLPANLLAAGDYELTLKGRTENRAEPLGYYYFGVRKD